MKIKIDENLPLSLAEGLRNLGHDVHSVFDERLNGRPDTEVWAACSAENRFLITQDLDSRISGNFRREVTRES